MALRLGSLKGREVSGAAFCSAEAIFFRGSSEMCRASLEMVSVVVDAKMRASKTLEGLTTLETPYFAKDS